MTTTHNGHDKAKLADLLCAKLQLCQFARSYNFLEGRPFPVFKDVQMIEHGFNGASTGITRMTSINWQEQHMHFKSLQRLCCNMAVNITGSRTLQKCQVLDHKCLCMCAVAWLMMDNVRRRSESKGSKLSCKVSSDAPLHTLTHVYIYIIIYIYIYSNL